jgi:hypothetical protein
MHVGWGLGFWQEMDTVRRDHGLRGALGLFPGVSGTARLDGRLSESVTPAPTR